MQEEMVSKTKITVRYAETDRMGIAHHSNYAVWFEAARTDFIKQTGIGYGQMEERGLLAPLLELTCRFIAPAYYEDELIVTARVTKLTPVKMEFSYEVFREGEKKPLATGKTLHGLVGRDMKPFHIKKDMPDIYEKLQMTVQPEEESK